MRHIKAGPFDTKPPIGLPLTRAGEVVGKVVSVDEQERGLIVTVELDDDVDLGWVLSFDGFSVEQPPGN